MRRRDLLWSLPLAALLGARPARSEQEGRVFRLALLETLPRARNKANVDALVDALRALGYVEGRNLAVDYRSADGHTERFAELVAAAVDDHPDVIVTRGTPAAMAASSATTSIPIVMAAIGEPLRVVGSLARPRGNVTGLSALVTELEGKRIELLRELRPGVKRIAGLWNMANPASAAEHREAVEAARALGVSLQLLDVRKPEDLDGAFAAARAERVEGLIVGLDTLTQANAARIASGAIEQRLPAVYAAREFVDEGGLLFYGVDYPALYRRAASYVAKIFQGAAPSDLPVEQPTLFSLAINMHAAKAVGLTVPQSILLRADEVIE